MEEKFDFEGWWWLPEYPDDKIPGIAKIDQGKFTELKLFGAFKSDFDISKDKGIMDNFVQIHHPIILGSKRGADLITLYDCQGVVLCGHIAYPQTKYNTSQFNARFALLDIHILEDNYLKIKKLTIDFDYLNNWVNVERGSSEKISRNKIIIEGKVIKPIIISINDDLKLIFDFQNFPHYFMVNKPGFDETVIIRLTSKKGLTIMECFEIIKKLRNFLSFAIQKPAYPTSLWGKVNKTKFVNARRENLNVFKIYTVFNGEKTEYKNLLPGHMMFTFKCIRNKIDIIFRTWLLNTDHFELAYDFYFSMIYNKNLYLEHQFMSYINAIEGFHRRQFKNQKFMPKNKFREKILKPLKNAIPKDIDNVLRENILSSIGLINEIKLKQRLNQIFEEYSDNFKKQLLHNFNNQEELITKIVKVRNYMSHILEEHIEFDEENYSLKRLTNRLKVIAETCLLKHIGLEQPSIEAFAGRSLYNYYQ